MHCKEIMSRDVQWIEPNVTITRVAELMAFHNLGFMPICGVDGKPLGVITDRDIALRVAAKNRMASRTKVRKVMSAPLHSVGLDCPVADAGEMMAEQGVSRLLVLNEDGALEGVVSLADLTMRGPAHTALAAARGIYARETGPRSEGHPHPASDPKPEYFHGIRDFELAENNVSTNPARTEAEAVASGNDNYLKEFP